MLSFVFSTIYFVILLDNLFYAKINNIMSAVSMSFVCLLSIFCMSLVCRLYVFFYNKRQKMMHFFMYFTPCFQEKIWCFSKKITKIY